MRRHDPAPEPAGPGRGGASRRPAAVRLPRPTHTNMLQEMAAGHSRTFCADFLRLGVVPQAISSMKMPRLWRTPMCALCPPERTLASDLDPDRGDDSEKAFPA